MRRLNQQRLKSHSQLPAWRSARINGQHVRDPCRGRLREPCHGKQNGRRKTERQVAERPFDRVLKLCGAETTALVRLVWRLNGRGRLLSSLIMVTTFTPTFDHLLRLATAVFSRSAEKRTGENLCDHQRNKKKAEHSWSQLRRSLNLSPHVASVQSHAASHAVTTFAGKSHQQRSRHFRPHRASLVRELQRTACL